MSGVPHTQPSNLRFSQTSPTIHTTTIASSTPSKSTTGRTIARKQAKVRVRVARMKVDVRFRCGPRISRESRSDVAQRNAGERSGVVIFRITVKTLFEIANKTRVTLEPTRCRIFRPTVARLSQSISICSLHQRRSSFFPRAGIERKRFEFAILFRVLRSHSLYSRDK